MGKTKIKTIDDSREEVKKEKPSKKVTKAERAMTDVGSRLSEAGEIRPESTSSDVHEEDQAGDEQSESAELENPNQASEQSLNSTDQGIKHENNKSEEQKVEKKTQPKQGKAKPRSKKYQQATESVDPTQKYSLKEAIDLAKRGSYTKFDGTLELHINTKQANLRGLVLLPHASGKKLTILAFGPSASSGLGKELLADEVNLGDEKTLEEIEKGKIDFDILITTPEWMPKLAKVAKVLGPRGLMPSPKNGTITEDLKKAVLELQAGKTEYKTEAKAPVIHISVGKVSQPESEISENIKAIYNVLGKSRVNKITIAPSMGPGVKIDPASL
ncbi:50S ribosomal protein L1 [Candidatus Daviesbacteria bacterium]|nr:50S ribosomal protein L1 [Candidatus Daviesbacteria bacterium]